MCLIFVCVQMTRKKTTFMNPLQIFTYLSDGMFTHQSPLKQLQSYFQLKVGNATITGQGDEAKTE